jgi:hypothetical protein
MSDLVEFRHLKYIVAIAENSNFTRAAERLFIAQPSLSRQVRDLENEVGFTIFERTREGVRITPSGQMLVDYAQEALNGRTEIIKIAREVHLGKIAPLRLGFSSFINPKHLQTFVLPINGSSRTAECNYLVAILFTSCSVSNVAISIVRFCLCQLRDQSGVCSR